MPHLLEEIVNRLREAGPNTAERVRELADRHAIHRLDHSYELEMLLGEYRVLRATIFKVLGEHRPEITLREVAELDHALDEAVSASICTFADARIRTLEALDRISGGSGEDGGVDGLIQRLLGATISSFPEVDIAVLFLCDGDRLTLRASASASGVVAAELVEKLRQEVALEVARSRTPLEISPEVRGVRAVFGVPLFAGDELLGVALIASQKSARLGAEDRLVFRLIADRSATALVERERERTHAYLDAVLAAAPIGIGLIDRSLRYVRVNDTLAALSGRSPNEHVRRLATEVLEERVPMLDCELELPPRAPGERPRWLSGSYFPIRDRNGAMLGAGVVVSDISAAKHLLHDAQEARRQLAETNALLETLFEHAPIGLAFLDLELRYLRVNTALGEVLGHPVAKEIEARARGVLETGRPVLGIELRGRGRDWLASFYPVPAGDGGWRGIGVVVTEITDRKRQEERDRFVAEVGMRLAQTLDLQETLDAIAELAVPRISDLCVIDLVRENGMLELRSRYPRHEGLGVTSTLTVPLTAHGRTIGALSLATSESKRRLDEASSELAVELAHRASFAISNARLYQQAQEEVRLRESVLAIVSHDLRNPLGVIMMSVGVLHQQATAGEGGHKIHEIANRIQRSAERMHRLITDLIDFASIQAGRLAIELRKADPAALARESAEAIAFAAEENGVKLEVRLEPELPPIFCDRDRVLQVLSNVLGNALKVTPRGGTIEISARRRGEELEFRVHDTGPGISEQDLERIFDRYFRAEGAVYKGTGLGLAIAKGLVEAHGGRIWAESVAGDGATFAFTIPLGARE